MKDLSKKYEPAKTEEKIYQKWLRAGFFKPVTRNKQLANNPYVIAMPPPNITGSLHMGHALNNIINDILIRRARMKGQPALWIPGTDHAGIATQNVVERELAKEGKTRQDLGREEFIKHVWQWREKYGHIIIDQLKKLGLSCDWSRERFTMDEGYSEAVNTAFKHYYDKGLIYQGERVINWCPRCQTALSDIELEYQEKKGKLWFIRYPLAMGQKTKVDHITVATTRPETMLGDTAVAVNPKDSHYKDLVGKIIILPLMGRRIPIVEDIAVDPKFGTGAVKVTPAHDLNDWEIGQRHDLKLVRVIDEQGKMTKKAGKYRDFDRYEARKMILEDLENAGIIEKTADYTHNISLCYRCGTISEPTLSKQWFLKMAELVKPAMEVVQKNKIIFTPPQWKKVYLDWLKNVRDWCISRQIWWGHRLPVWQSEVKTQNSRPGGAFKLKTEEIYVGDEPPEGYVQSEDVLDTWFSSALWPFAILGWPEKTNDLKTYYPTTLLSTARDILFLWVARMVFSGIEFMGKIPFSEVYIHPTIFAKSGQRMSKSLGTGVDPLELTDKYGTDAVRFGLCYMNTGTQDIKYSEEAILAGQKFANKIWNSARYIMIKMPNVKAQMSNQTKNPKPKTESDKRIIKKLNQTIESVDKDLDKFRFGQAAHTLYDFYWHDFCDIYLEKSKEQIDDPKLKDSTLSILLYTLSISLALLHPIMPFITEEIWQKLPGKKKLLIISEWPL